MSVMYLKKNEQHANRVSSQRSVSSSAAKGQLYRHLLLIGMAAVMFYPLLWMMSASFRNDSAISDPGLWPGTNFTLGGYTEGWKGIAGVPFWRFLLNSLLVALLCVIGNVVACSITAYAFARIQFRFKGVLFALMLGTLMLPHHVLLVPQYIMFRELGWIDTYLPFIIPKMLATDAFFVFLLTQFFRAIPKELDEAARLDGCGHIRIFLRIILPLSKPALATAAIFSFIYSWNDFFTPLIYLTNTNLYTVPLALRAFIDTTSGSSFGALFAMSLVSLLPVLGVFVAAQRLLVEGIATSGLKG
ncbi:carbohydrate ABC transporter permease [Subtercola frigoramans]|uniref:Multiple sugar transport system permease protein n=1 Tax=Subtercola frigoramans TaxID=120298 RepID=A0ABS2L2H8_9MICO|nr:carbohydrate ABC transporter permease [Subtercola frigoramans]MBM7471284.1 multiple sugar transport system permease protein [Subtercola frigoramans]